MEYKDVQSIVTEIENNKMTLLTGSTTTCGVCTAVTPKLKEISSRYNLLTDIYVKVDKLEEIAGKYMIFTVPTVILFVDGKEVHRESRIIDFKRLEFEIDRWHSHLSSI